MMHKEFVLASKVRRIKGIIKAKNWDMVNRYICICNLNYNLFTDSFQNRAISKSGYSVQNIGIILTKVTLR